MSIEILKKQIVATVDATQDEVLLQDVMDILSQQSFIGIEKNVKDSQFTRFCMAASEKSLSEAWDNEDDERWNTLLKG